MVLRTLRVAALTLALAGATACGSSRGAESPDVPIGGRPQFSYPTLDGKPFSTASVAGRITVIGFGTTYDLPSQAQARYLNALFHGHSPRLNVALLILEPADNLPLMITFADTLKLDYQVALSDPPTIAGTGPFTGVDQVPSVVILDAKGRERWRKLGPADEATLEEAVRAIEQADAAP